MLRPAVSGAHAHRSRPVPVLPSRLLAAACSAAGPGGLLGGSAARLIAPNLRGRVDSRTLATMEAKGLRVHRVGHAAYVHGAGAHWILAVWDRGEPAPAFAARLGRVSDGYRRRCERIARETRHQELARIRGRVLAARLAGDAVMGVTVSWQRTAIEPPLEALAGCWRCGDKGRPMVAGYYCGGGRADKAPWRPVCEPCDLLILSDPDGDGFALGLWYWSPARSRRVELAKLADADVEGR